MLSVPNGLIMPMKSLPELISLIEEIRKQCSLIRENEQLKILVNMTTKELDSRTLGLKSKQLSVISKIMNDVSLINEMIKEDPEMELNFELKLSFHPLEDKILIQYWSNQMVYLKALELIPGIKEYHLFEDDENTSLPEKQQRNADWEKVFSREKVEESQSGLQVLIAEGHLSMVSAEKILSAFPDFSFRVKKMVLALEETEYQKMVPQNERSVEGFQDFISSPVSKKRQEENSKIIGGSLIGRPRTTDLI